MVLYFGVLQLMLFRTMPCSTRFFCLCRSLSLWRSLVTAAFPLGMRRFHTLGLSARSRRRR